jgi:hypothetical protein
MPLLLLPRVVAPGTARAKLHEASAPPGDWAVAGAFRYEHRDPAGLVGREAVAFSSSWLGIASFAPALRVEVAEIAPAALEEAARLLAARILDAWPDATPAQAVDAALEEVEFALALCAHPRGTILELRREFGEQGLVERASVVSGPRGAG